MRFLLCVFLPLLFQLAVAALFIVLPKHGGAFVGLWVMLLGLAGVPLTVMINWLRIRRHRETHWLDLVVRTFFTTLVYPLLCAVVYLIAS